MSNEITSLLEPWSNNHTHEEVENFLKSQLNALWGESKYGSISIDTDITTKYFITGSSDADNLSFNYTVTYKKGEKYLQTAYYKLTWQTHIGGTVHDIRSGSLDTSQVYTTPNLAPIFENENIKEILVKLYVYDEGDVTDENGSTTTQVIASSSVTVNFIRSNASITSNNGFGQDASLPLSYIVRLDGNSTGAIIGGIYYNGNKINGDIYQPVENTDIDEKQRTYPISNIESNFDFSDNAPYTVRVYLKIDKINNHEIASANLITDNIESTIVYNSDLSDTEHIIYEDFGRVYENTYVDIKFKLIGPHNSDEYVPIALQEKNANAQYVTKVIRNVYYGVENTWRYFASKEAMHNNSDIIQLRICKPIISPPNNISYDNMTVRSFIDFQVSRGNIEWTRKARNSDEFYLTAQGKTNNDYDVDIWSDNGYSMFFDNVKWEVDGSCWKDIILDNNSKASSIGIPSTALHLVGDSKAYIRLNDDGIPDNGFYPFYHNSYRGILDTNGMTLKMSFMVSNVTNPNEKVIDCYSDEDGIGFYVTGDTIYIKFKDPELELISNPNESQRVNTHNVRKFASNTKIDLTIVVQPYQKGYAPTEHEIRYYINGEIAGFAKYGDATNGITQDINKTLLTFGGTGATLDLFDVRYYKRDLTAYEVLQTRTMDLDNVSLINSIYKKNSYFFIKDNDPNITFKEAIEYGKYLAEQGKTNFGVWITTNLCNSSAHVGNTSSNSNNPESFYLYRFKTDSEGNGIIDPDLTFFVEAAGIDIENKISYLRMRRQGTSTKDSTKGNIRIDVYNSCIYHKYNSETGTFYEDNEDNRNNGYVRTIGKKEKIWQIPDANAIPCYLLTCKKNPNESTQARNLPTAKWYEDCCRYLATIRTSGTEENPVYGYEDCLTMPQRKELESIIANRPNLTSRSAQVAAIKTRQCIDGIPSLGFEIQYGDLNNSNKLNPINLSDYILFGGQFDMITDKTNMEVFGFGGYHTQDENGNLEWHKNVEEDGDDDFSIEWRKNNSQICNFLTQDLSVLNGTNAGGNTSFNDLLYRYPEDPPSGLPYPVDSDVVISESAALGVYTKGMESNGPIQKLFDFVRNCAIGENKDGNGLYPIDGEEGTQYVDGVEFENYIPQNTDTGVTRLQRFHDYLGDYVVLNQFIFNAIAIDIALMVDQNTKNQFFTHFTGETKNGNKLLRLLGYDFDSSWGMDNDNRFRFSYTVKYEDNLYDGMAEGGSIAGRRGPVLWHMFYKAFSDEIKTMAGYLCQGFLSKDAILRRMEDDQVDIYNALIYNANSEYSYREKPTDYLKTHGAAKEHTEWFVNGRTYYYSARNSSGNVPMGDFGIGRAHFIPGYFNDQSDPMAPNQGVVDGVKNWEIRVSGYERTAASLRYGADNFYEIMDIDDDGTETALVMDSSTTVTQSDAHIYLYGGKHLKTIKGLSNWYISSIDDFGDLINMEELEIGSTSKINNIQYYNPHLNSFPSNVTFGSLKKLNLAGCIGISGNLDLTKMPILEEFEGSYMTGVTSISLPSGNSLIKLHLSTGLTKLIIKNKPNLQKITFNNPGESENGDTLPQNLTEIEVIDSSEYIAKYVIEKFLM